MITFKIDALTPCLKDSQTGELYETEVVRIRRKSFLSKFNSRNGWYVNWGKFESDTEVYALVLRGTMDIQGMVALEPDENAKAIHILWACTAPHNNIWEYGQQRFTGVGGHLFAIASDISVQRGYDGYVWGEAMDEDILRYYCEEFGATPLPRRSTNPFALMVSGAQTAKLREAYTYEWTEEEV